VPLSAWLKYAADPNPALNADVGDPSEAVRQIGTNGIPLLLQMLEMPDSEPGRNLSASPQSDKVKSDSAASANQKAAIGFMILGDAARDAVRELVAIYERHSSDSSQCAAARSLGSVGPAAAEAVPSLLRGLETGTPQVKSATIQALGDIHAESKTVIPVLANYLNSTEIGVRPAAILAIGHFGDEAKAFAPQFIGLLQDSNREIRVTASIALGYITPEGNKPEGARRYSLSYVSQAYSRVAIFRMLCEINHCAQKLHLPMPDPMTERDLTSKFVGSPRVTGRGYLETSRFAFGFSPRGILCYITWLHPFGNEPLTELHQKQAHLKSLVDREQALELARDWLKSIDVSVPDLERTCTLAVEQQFFYPGATPTGSTANLQKVYLPIYNISWSRGEKAAVKVSIYGPTRELLYLRQEDDSFSGRPAGLVKDAAALESISDAEFLKYSESQLHALIVSNVAVTDELGKYLYQTNGHYTNLLIQTPLVQRTNNSPVPARR
jgi:hypothetical protein